MVGACHGKESLKLSVGQYRILDGNDSYGFTPIAIKYSTESYQARLSLPYINGFKGQSGVGNASLKLSYLSQWHDTYIDLNLRQKLGTADDRLTVPVSDTGMSIVLSRYILKGVGFVEVGHTWRHTEFSNLSNSAKRSDSVYYALGAMYPVRKDVSTGIILDHKPSALGQLDQSATLVFQYKLNKEHRFTMSLAKGLATTSSNYTAGLVWSYKL